ncbi:hypothetical protein ONZ45_g16297 [Pleurotus djamor]|nr:hypothetical protein ONZ45_g16297 [Pleurotus djamor]
MGDYEDMGEYPRDSVGGGVGDNAGRTQVEVAESPLGGEHTPDMMDATVSPGVITSLENRSTSHHIVRMEGSTVLHAPSTNLQSHQLTSVRNEETPENPQNPSRSDKRKKRSIRFSRAKRKERRLDEQAGSGLSVKAISIQRAQAAKRLNASYSADSARHAPSGYVGHRDRKGLVFNKAAHVPPRPLSQKSLDELIAEGFKLIEWDGIEGLQVVDQHDRIVLCGGSPRDETWSDVAAKCAQRIEAARHDCTFTDKQQRHRRGAFPALAAGFSFGQGLIRPSNITDRAPQNNVAMQAILDDHNIKRVAGFQSSLLDTCLPKLSSYYRQTMDGLQATQGELKRNFVNTQFGSITVNFGPQTVSIPHIDYANLATGMCAITALGDFDPDAGGHLVLWELGIVLRYPAGSTVLIPSALIHHSNLPIHPGERRYSITQYSAGGLFRWVENGYCSDKDSAIDKEHRRSIWEAGIDRLCKAHTGC